MGEQGKEDRVEVQRVRQLVMHYIFCGQLIITLLNFFQFSEWSSDFTPVDVLPFTQPTGPAQQATGDPAELFSLFFTDYIIDGIVEETNHYAALCLEGKETTWSTTKEEIQACFGFYILMGLVRQHRPGPNVSVDEAIVPFKGRSYTTFICTHYVYTYSV